MIEEEEEDRWLVSTRRRLQNPLEWVGANKAMNQMRN